MDLNDPVPMSKPKESLSPGAFIVLGLLLEEPRSGYDLVRVAERGIGHFWPITKAHIYVELPRLEALGYAKGERVTQSGARPKIVYAATDEGIARFRSWIADSDLGAAKLHHPLLLKVYFARWLGPRALARVLDEAEALAKATRTGYAARLAEGATRTRTGPRSVTPLRGATLRYGVARLDAELAWIAEVRASLG